MPLATVRHQAARRSRRAAGLSRDPGVRGGVAYFTDTFDELNGVSLTGQHFLRYCRGAGHPLCIYAPASDGVDLPVKGVVRLTSRIGRLPLPWYPQLRLALPSRYQVLQVLQRQAPAVVHAATPGPMGWVARAAARSLGVPFCAAYHTHLPEYSACLTGWTFAGDLTWAAERRFYGSADRILVPSRATAAYLQQRGLPADRIRVFWRGVDSERFSPRHRVPSFWPSRLGEPLPVVLYVGRVSREKNLDDFAAAAGEVNMPRRRAWFVVVGGGPYAAEFARLARAIPGLVAVGELTGLALSQAYASADLFYFPSTTDTFGNVVLEALASGLPCLVTDRGGPAEQVEHGRTGFVLPGRAPAAAAAAIRTLLEDPVRLRAMGEAARRAAVARSEGAGFEAMWRLILETPGSGRRPVPRTPFAPSR